MSAKSIHSISSRFALLKPEKIAKISPINNNRAETIAAGSCVIDILMEKLGFDEIIVSAQGLREGTLSLSLEYSKEFATGKIDQDHIQNSIRYSDEPDIIPQYLEDIVRFMVSAGFMSEQERLILAHSLRQIPNSSTFQNITNFLVVGMDVDSHLSHRDQLISILSIIHTKKKKRLEKIFDMYNSILQPADKKSIKKLSVLLLLSEVLSKADAKIKAKLVNNDLIKMKIYPSKNRFPTVLFDEVCGKLSDTLNIDIDYSVINSKYSVSQTVEIQ
jgi:exopolyphosphatase/guanosine-5'-triphosphate,3'-diphosphate pyrophosphatase